MRAGQQPALTFILVAAGVIGFALGTGLGNAGRPTSAAAAAPTASPTATVPPSPSPFPSPSPDPTASPSPSAGPTGTPEILFSIEGTKHEVTDNFEAKPGWQIQWEIDGDALAIAVSGDPNLGVVVDQKGPASGVTGIAQGGTFTLDIVASGPWKITVIEGDYPAAS